MQRSSMPAGLAQVALFHSFPRAYKDRPDEVESGLAFLREVLHTGLLLFPEKITFPKIYPNLKLDYAEGSEIYQLRCCFTLMHEFELKHHAAQFGAFSLEFEVNSMRRLGAFPVIYIPQPASGPHALVSAFGNVLVHQLRDVVTLLAQMSMMRKAAADQEDFQVLEFGAGGQNWEILARSIKDLCAYLERDKGSFEVLYNYMEALSNMFYHTDSARTTHYSTARDLSYYAQREWRLISGFAPRDREYDRPLERSESDRIAAANPRSLTEMQFRSGAFKRVLDVIRVVVLPEQVSVGDFVKAIWVPDVAKSRVQKIFDECGVDRGKIRDMRYSDVLNIRSSSHR